MFLIFPILTCFSLNAQSEWEVHTAINIITELEFYDNKAFVTHRGGLLVIDLVNGEEQNWTSNNSGLRGTCLLYTSPSPRDGLLSRMPSSA